MVTVIGVEKNVLVNIIEFIFFLVLLLLISFKSTSENQKQFLLKEELILKYNFNIAIWINNNIIKYQ